MVVLGQFFLGITREIQARGLVRRSLVAADSMPAKVAIALTTWQRGAIQIDALALDSAVGIAGALVVVLTLRSVVVLLALAARCEVFAIARAGFAEVFALPDIHIGARPETIASRPFISLTQQAESAVEALEVLWQIHVVRLGATRKII